MGLLATFYRTLHSVPCPPPKSNLVETFLVEQLNGRRFLAQILKYFCFTLLTMWTRIPGWTWNLSVRDLTHFDYFMDYCTAGSRNTSLTETDLLWVTSPFPSQALLQGPWNKVNKRLHQMKDPYHKKIHPSFSAQYPWLTFDFSWLSCFIYF